MEKHQWNKQLDDEHPEDVQLENEHLENTGTWTTSAG